MRLPLVLMLAFASCVAPVMAEEEAAPAPPAWTGESGLSYVATSGNTDTRTLGFSFALNRIPDPWGWEFKAGYLRAEQDGDTTAERTDGSARAVRAVNERWDLFGGVGAEKNVFAGYDLRVLTAVGATYKALLGPVHTLSFDGGASWTMEEFVDDTDNDYLGALLGLSYAWQISDTATLGERLVWNPNFDDSSDWTAVSETSLTAAVRSNLAVKLGYLYRFDNRPLEGFDDTDTTTTASLVVKF